MTQKSMGYDHPAYQARMTASLGQAVAGANAQSQKFVAFAALQAFAVAAALITAGTSTTTGYNGSATTTSLNGGQFSLIHVFANNGGAVTTATHGPFNLGAYNGTATAVQTGTAGMFVSVPLGGSGVTGNVQAGAQTAPGGIQVNPGDQLYVVQGTDATQVGAYALEYGLQPFANVTA